MNKVKSVELIDGSIAKVRRLDLIELFTLAKYLETEHVDLISAVEEGRTTIIEMLKGIIDIGVNLDKLLDQILVEHVTLYDFQDLSKIIEAFVEVNDFINQKNFLANKFSKLQVVMEQISKA